MLSTDLAELYGVEPRVLVQAVKRNLERFPADFMFQLTTEERAALRSQIVILETGRGQHPKYAPYAFTEQGVAMLSSVLRRTFDIANFDVKNRPRWPPYPALRVHRSRASPCSQLS